MIEYGKRNLVNQVLDEQGKLEALGKISRRHIGNDRAQELTQETLCIMLDNEPEHPGQFKHQLKHFDKNFTKISRNAAARWKRQEAKIADIDPDILPDNRHVNDLDDMLDALPKHLRLIAELTYMQHNQKAITSQLHISPNTLTKKRQQIGRYLTA